MVSLRRHKLELMTGKSQDDAQVCSSEAHAQAERPAPVSFCCLTAKLTLRKENVEKAAKKAAKVAAAEEKRNV